MVAEVCLRHLYRESAAAGAGVHTLLLDSLREPLYIDIFYPIAISIMLFPLITRIVMLFVSRRMTVHIW